MATAVAACPFWFSCLTGELSASLNPPFPCFSCSLMVGDWPFEVAWQGRTARLSSYLYLDPVCCLETASAFALRDVNGEGSKAARYLDVDINRLMVRSRKTVGLGASRNASTKRFWYCSDCPDHFHSANL